jgi:hypothetical protein
MKSFKEYLTESKKVYEFKVKIAGKCPDDCAKLIKSALAKYSVESCSPGKRTPIQERYEDFPNLSNVEMTIFDVTTAYPATSLQVRASVSDGANVPLSNVVVRNLAEELELEINHVNDEKSGEALLDKPYKDTDNQGIVGQKHAFSMLKDLNKTKTQGEPYTGVNDQLLAKKAPSEKQSTTSDKTGTVSAIGSKKVKLPDPYQGR